MKKFPEVLKKPVALLLIVAIGMTSVTAEAPEAKGGGAEEGMGNPEMRSEFRNQQDAEGVADKKKERMEMAHDALHYFTAVGFGSTAIVVVIDCMVGRRRGGRGRVFCCWFGAIGVGLCATGVILGVSPAWQWGFLLLVAVHCICVWIEAWQESNELVHGAQRVAEDADFHTDKGNPTTPLLEHSSELG